MAVAPAAAKATANASGQAAVQASERTRQASQTRSEADLAKQSASFAAESAMDESRARAVAGRRFNLVAGVWTDAAHVRQAVTTVEPFSKAYFELLLVLPELEAAFKSFDQVLVAGRNASIKITKGGTSQMTEAELNKLVLQFRAN